MLAIIYSLCSFLSTILDSYTFIKLTVVLTSQYTFLFPTHLYLLVFCTNLFQFLITISRAKVTVKYGGSTTILKVGETQHISQATYQRRMQIIGADNLICYRIEPTRKLVDASTSNPVAPMGSGKPCFKKPSTNQPFINFAY
jgi:hypothetical protein